VEAISYTQCPQCGGATDGIAHPRGHFCTCKRVEPGRRNGRIPETVTATDLMAAELPPVRWVVPGVLPEGVTLLAGKPKLGKSWLVLGMCLAVAIGGVALGTRHVEQGEVLYLALEDNRRRLQKRLGKMLGGPAPRGLEMATTWPRLNEGGVEALGAWLLEHPEARLIAVDTLAKTRPLARGQNVYQEDYAALEELLPLAAEHGVAVVVVHHTRKMAAADPLDEISGSTGLTGGWTVCSFSSATGVRLMPCCTWTAGISRSLPNTP
jgi:AAA domain